MQEETKSLNKEGVTAVREAIRKTVKSNLLNVMAFGLVVVALASFFFPEDWTAFSRVLRWGCIIVALAMVFWDDVQKLIADLQKKKGGRRREIQLSVIAALALIAGFAALSIAGNTGDSSAALALRVSGFVFFAAAIAAMVWAYCIAISGTVKIWHLYRRTKTMDDEVELKALAAEINRIYKES